MKSVNEVTKRDASEPFDVNNLTSTPLLPNYKLIRYQTSYK